MRDDSRPTESLREKKREIQKRKMRVDLRQFAAGGRRRLRKSTSFSSQSVNDHVVVAKLVIWIDPNAVKIPLKLDDRLK